MSRSLRRRPSPPVEILDSGDRAILAPQWIPDTRFGAWLLSTHAWRRHVIQVALADLLRLLGDRSRPYPTVLDVGCGTGRALPLLDRLFRPRLLVGVDPDSAAIERASHEAERCRCRVQLRLGVATSLGLDDTSVDMIFCHQTFHHLADPDGAARELYRVLRPGGVLLFAESCAPFIRSLRVRLLFRHPLHAQKTVDEYLGLLRASGFELAHGAVSTPYPWWSRYDFGLLEWLGRPAAATHAETTVNLVAYRDHQPQSHTQ